MRIKASLVAILLPTSAPAPSHSLHQDITYTLPSPAICLQCPDYFFTLHDDGRGVFVGISHTASHGAHSFRASRKQTRAFFNRLRPYRPKNADIYKTRCKVYVTDGQEVMIAWHHGTEADAQLSFYDGCNPHANEAMAVALFGAPALLPIGDLIGKR